MAKAKYDLATVFFVGIIVVSIVGAFLPLDQSIVWLVLGICGALVAIQNIQIREEDSFLIGTIALVTVLTAFLVIPEFRLPLSYSFGNFSFGVLFQDLLVGFGTAGFIVALGLISRLGLTR